MGNVQTTVDWILVLSICVGLLYIGSLIFTNLINLDITCKTNDNCPAGRICSQGICKLLPGYSCSNDTDCSSYAPICHPSEKYCTNYIDKGRGFQGNPPNLQGLCHPQIILNANVNLCQGDINYPCTHDGDCNNGLCLSGTCQYSTGLCGGDEILNPNQCVPGTICSDKFQMCVIPGTDPGGPGSPCTSDSQCINGRCIPVTNGSITGICSSGLLGFLQIVTNSNAGNSCYQPLNSTGITFCAYDVATSMSCDPSSRPCQYPYVQCSNFLCKILPSTPDPITTLLTSNPYASIGFLASSVQTNGIFLKAELSDTSGKKDISTSISPSTPVIDYTGGRLIKAYQTFCPSCPDLSSLSGNLGLIFSFSKVSSFTVTSIIQPSPQSGVTTIVYDDDQPVLCATTIQQANISSTIFITPVFYFFRPKDGITMIQGREWVSPSTSAQSLQPGSVIWSHQLANDKLAAVIDTQTFFIPNPIVGSSGPLIINNSKQDTVYSHMLGYQPAPLDNYFVSVAFFRTKDDTTIQNFHPTSSHGNYYGGKIIFPVIDFNSNLQSADFVILGWDAYSVRAYIDANQSVAGTIFPSSNREYLVSHFLFQGKDQRTSKYGLYYMIALFGIGRNDGYNGLEFFNNIPGSVPDDCQCKCYPINISTEWQSKKNVHYKMIKNTQLTGPLISFIAFSPEIISPLSSTCKGIPQILLTMATIDTFSSDSVNQIVNLFLPRTNSCPVKLDVICGFDDIKYISSITTNLNDYGCFVIWGSRKSDRDITDMMALVRINATCVIPQTSSPIYSTAIARSAIYWALYGENVPPYPYFIVPVGGSPLPMFIVTNNALDYKGDPGLPVISN